MVNHNGALYVCSEDNINNDPDLNNNTWSILRGSSTVVFSTYILSSAEFLDSNRVCLKVHYLDTTLEGYFTVAGIIVET